MHRKLPLGTLCRQSQPHVPATEVLVWMMLIAC